MWNQPITPQQLEAQRHVDVKMTCWISNWVPEWSEKWLWTWHGCRCQTGWPEGFNKMLIYWDFHTDTISRVFSEKGDYPVKGSCVEEKVLLMLGHRRKGRVAPSGNILISIITCYCQYASTQKTMMGKRGGLWVLSAKNRKLRLQLTVCNLSQTCNYMMRGVLL